MPTWRDEIIRALQNLGGKAHLSKIYDEVEQITTKSIPRTLIAVIRDTLQKHSSDSVKFVDTGSDDFISYGDGVWGLRIRT